MASDSRPRPGNRCDLRKKGVLRRWIRRFSGLWADLADMEATDSPTSVAEMCRVDPNWCAKFAGCRTLSEIGEGVDHETRTDYRDDGRILVQPCLPRLAEDKKAGKSPDNEKVETKADLRAEIHGTMAALIEAQSAEEPDQAKIDRLTKKLQQLRGKLQAPAATGNQPAGWACPWGGPGRGFGRGAAWGGPGQGQGAVRGTGFGPGAGCGWSFGPGGGGRGFGPGTGIGRAPGGPAFVDQDNDGLCDYYEVRHGMHK